MAFYSFDKQNQEVVSPHYSTAHGGTVTAKTIEVGRYNYPGGTGASPHSHPEEQIIHVISGTIRWRIGDDEQVLEPGGVIHIPSNIEHESNAVTDVQFISFKNKV